MTLHQNVENLAPVNPLIHHHFLCDMAIFKQNQMVCTSKFPDHLEAPERSQSSGDQNGGNGYGFLCTDPRGNLEKPGDSEINPAMVRFLKCPNGSCQVSHQNTLVDRLLRGVILSELFL
jgi:hypothetical protein